MHQEISVSAITKKRVNKDGGSVKKEKKGFYFGSGGEECAWGRELASFKGGDTFLSEAVGTTGKADILNSSILPVRTPAASTASNAPFPPG